MGPIVEALRGGADVVITGRVTDTGLTLGPIFHEFGWPTEDWDKVAAGTVAGHIIECGAQCSGGNLLKDWRSVKGLGNPGFPDRRGLARRQLRGDQASGHRWRGIGRVGDASSWSTRWAIRRAYITPDGVADFTTIQLEQAGRDRVRVSGIRGGPRTPMLKVSVAYFYGYKAVGTLVYSWPDAYDKAQRGRPHPARAAEGPGPRVRADPDRVRGRQRHPWCAQRPARSRRARGPAPGGRARRERAPVERFTREIAPLVLTGPPSVTGFAGGRPAVEEVVAYWPALDRSPAGRARREGRDSGSVGGRQHGGTSRQRASTLRGSRACVNEADHSKRVGMTRCAGPKKAEAAAAAAAASAARIQLRYLAHARSGDKGDTANVGLIALEPEYYPSCGARSPSPGWPGTSREW